MNEDSKREPPAPGALAFMLVALVVVFTAAGYGLDRWLGTTPWLMVVGVFAGFGVGLTYLVLISSSGPSHRRTGKSAKDDHEGPEKGPS